jgi:hypothetical protein
LCFESRRTSLSDPTLPQHQLANAAFFRIITIREGLTKSGNRRDRLPSWLKSAEDRGRTPEKSGPKRLSLPSEVGGGVDGRVHQASLAGA